MVESTGGLPQFAGDDHGYWQRSSLKTAEISGAGAPPMPITVYYVRSIITTILPLSPVNHQWPLYVVNKKKCTPVFSLVIKRCTRFRTQVRIRILHLSIMHHIFTLCFNQLQHLHLMSSGHVVKVI